MEMSLGMGTSIGATVKYGSTSFLQILKTINAYIFLIDSKSVKGRRARLRVLTTWVDRMK